jgi:hypothetical protein
MKQLLPIGSVAKRPSPVDERLTRNLADIKTTPHETSALAAILNCPAARQAVAARKRNRHRSRLS